jgi:hypothetical protein
MALANFRDTGSELKDLQAACDGLWEECIRNDLIYGRNLWLCLPCLAFFYATPDADHPRDQCVIVQRYFSERSITSLAKLLEFMKDALGHNSKVDSVRAELSSGPSKPIMSKAHSVRAPKRPHLAPDNELRKSKDNMARLQVELTNCQEENRALQDQAIQLKQENEALLIELLRERESKGMNNKIILGLIDQIAGVCYEGTICECNCGAKEADSKPEQPK